MTDAPITSLAGCAAKLRRAKAHFDEFDRLAYSFIEQMHPYEARPEVDAETGVTVVRLLEDVAQPPSEEWGPIIGDVAHNLMCALDHLVCQLSIRNGGDTECADTEFPIFAALDANAERQILRRIGTLDPEDQRLIRELQPYQRGDQSRRHPLWLLREMSVIDKHRRLHLVNAGVWRHRLAVLKVNRAGEEAPDVRIVDIRESQGTKRGDEIFRFRVVREGQVKGMVNLMIITVIEFGEGSGVLVGGSVRTLIPQIFAFLYNHVFPKFEDRVGKLSRLDLPPQWESPPEWT